MDMCVCCVVFVLCVMCLVLGWLSLEMRFRTSSSCKMPQWSLGITRQKVEALVFVHGWQPNKLGKVGYDNITSTKSRVVHQTYGRLCQ